MAELRITADYLHLTTDSKHDIGALFEINGRA